MRNQIHSHQFLDPGDKPAGGTTYGTGFCISWQNGPLGRQPTRAEPNGAFVEDIIDAARDRLRFYQRSKFACEENAQAIEYLTHALELLESRTRRRETAGVEGTHAGG